MPSRRPRALPGEIETVRLENGLEVVLAANRQAPIVSTALFYRVGARDEPAGSAGLAHFLEHMMFKGSERFGPGEVDRRTQALGGTNNAFTSHDVTAYWFSFAADRWSEGLEIEADRMRGLLLVPREVEAERRVIVEEIAMYEDDPWDSLELAVERELFGAHPYGRSVLGTEEELASVSGSVLAEFHRRFYRPDNAVLAVAGAIGSDALERIATAFGAVEAGASPRAGVGAPAPALVARRVERRRGELTRLLWAIPAPPLDTPDHAELRLLATILAEGRASRLQSALVDEGQLALGVSATLSENTIATYLGIAADLLPGSSELEVETIVLGELASLRDVEVTEEELERARQVFFADWVHGLERIHEQALAAGIAAALFDLEQPERLLAAVAEATPASLARAASRWLDASAGAVLGISHAEEDGPLETSEH